MMGSQLRVAPAPGPPYRPANRTPAACNGPLGPRRDHQWRTSVPAKNAKPAPVKPSHGNGRPTIADDLRRRHLDSGVQNKPHSFSHLHDRRRG